MMLYKSKVNKQINELARWHSLEEADHDGNNGGKKEVITAYVPV